MNSFLQQDCLETSITNPELGKLSKEAINHLKNQSNIQNGVIKTAPSAVILKHCKQLLDNHSLRKPSAWGKEPLLSVDDVKLLRHIVESNERYQCLKAEDSALLKEILVSHMSEVESHQKFLWQFLKTLQDKRKNALKKRVIDMGERTNTKRVNSDSVVSKRKEAAEKRRSISSRTSKETEHIPSLKSYSKYRKIVKKFKYESFYMCAELKTCIAVSWEIALVTHTISETRIAEDYAYYYSGENSCFDLNNLNELNDKQGPFVHEKIFKTRTQKYNENTKCNTLITSQSIKEVEKANENSQLMSLRIPKNARIEQMKNLMVFLTHVILFAVLVLCVKMFDFHCVA